MRQLIPKLATLLDVYYDTGELCDLGAVFGVHLEVPEVLGGHSDSKQEMLAWARQIIERLDHGDYRALLDTIVEQVDFRNSQGLSTEQWERRDVHRGLVRLIQEVRDGLAHSGSPSEIAVSAGKPFTAKSQIRELLEQATTPVFVVDPWVGSATLDCLRGVATGVRLLTSTHPEAIEPRFEIALGDFRTEGLTIEVRRADRLHDRHLIFNERCWLVGSSLKDAGKKALHCIEIVDSKSQVIAELEARWEQAGRFG